MATLGPYEVLSELGRGGMGIVLRARAPDGREVAIKVLRRAGAKEALPRFERERRLQELLGEEAGFVPLVDAGDSPQGPFLVMPFCEGGTLRDKLDRGLLGIDETIELGKTLARSLGRAHARGIVHRDVKPENVLFRKDGRALVADLGLAKHFLRDAPGASASVSLSQGPGARGTVGYLPREQIEDAKSVGPPADVFALGAVLYECLAGVPAFSGASVVEVVRKIGEGKVEPVSSLRPETPDWLARAVERALAPAWQARFQDGEELASALARGPSGKRVVLVVAALAVIAVAVVLAFVFLGGEESGETPAPPPPPKTTSPKETRRDEARRQAERAFALADRQDMRAAEAEARSALALDPACPLALAARALALAETSPDAAIADAARAIELDPKLARGHVARAAARLTKGDHDGALIDGTRAIELDRTLAKAWYVRGAARFEKGDVSGCIEDETLAVTLDPKSPHAWCLRAEARSERGPGMDLNGALADAEKGVALAPGSAYTWTVRARVRNGKRDHEGAIADATRAIELGPATAPAWFWRGFAKLGKGDEKGAIEDLDKAIELNPDDADAYFHRSVARTQTDPRGAAADLERFLELKPNDPRAANARIALEELKRR